MTYPTFTPVYLAVRRGGSDQYLRSERPEEQFLLVLIPEYEGITLLRNVGKFYQSMRCDIPEDL